MTVVEYSNAPDLQFWQGIRYLSDNYYIMCGTNQLDQGIFYVGPLLNYNSNNNYNVNYPGSNKTSIYGPDYVGAGVYRLVGSYRKDTDNSVYGFFYQGTTKDFTNPNNFKTVFIGSTYTYVHSTMGNILAGNYDEYNLGPIQAFLMVIDTGKVVKVSYPGSTSNTVYGVWHNGDGNYTLCGGYSTAHITGDKVYNNFKTLPIDKAYIVNYNVLLDQFTNWTTIEYPYAQREVLTHFQGISSSKKGVYQLVADTIHAGAFIASFVKVNQNQITGIFKLDEWFNYKYPLPLTITSSNSVANNAVVGTYIDTSGHAEAFQGKISC
jgi:hypothetical protein